MKVASLVALMFLAVPATRASAQVATFDFSDLPILSRDVGVSDYMSGVYGSSISTSGARASHDRSDDVSDTFISTSLQLFDRGNFEILFDDVPIAGLEFEGHIIDATVGDDFTMLAFFDNNLVYELSRNEGVEIFDTGWVDFLSPVNRLVFSDSGRKDVGVDDFSVISVPEPAASLLLLIGGLGAVFRRFK